MMKTTLKNITFIITSLVVTACKDAEDPVIIEEKNNYKNVPDKEVFIPSVTRKESIVGRVKSSLKNIQSEPDFIQAAQKEIESYYHPSFDDLTSNESVTAAMVNDVLLSDALRDSNSEWTSTHELKQAVIGKFSLMTGLIGAPDSQVTPELPKLLKHGDHPTRKDLLVLQIIKQATRVAEKRVSMEDDYLPGWIDLAGSSNEVYRYAAILLFDLIDPTEEQSDLFFKVYKNEDHEEILKLLEHNRHYRETINARKASE